MGTPTYNILSLDGGGLRGIITLTMMERLDEAVPGWRTGIDMYAGTSTGGMIALALAKGMTPAQILDVYVKDGPKIFDRSLWHEIADLGEAVGPKYDSKNREQVCESMLGNSRLRDFLKKDGHSGHVVVTAFDLEDKHEATQADRSWKAKIFHNVPARTNDDDGFEYASKVAMATSAAPTYFGSYEGYVDGGVFANNPCMCALAQTQDDRNCFPVALNAVRMLSLGTGSRPCFLDADENWGLAQWAPKLVNLLMDGVNEVADFQARQLLGPGQYNRADVDMTVDIAMDDATKAGVMQRIGASVDLGKTIVFLKTCWSQVNTG